MPQAMQASKPAGSVGHTEIVERAKALAPRFAARAEAAEAARRMPPESVKDMLDAGFARILLPEQIGGYGLGFDTWFAVMRELSKADASHGWCAGLIIHHAHLMAQFTKEAQDTIWADGLDVAVAASFAPNVQAVPVDGGYRISGKGSPFASGVDHSTWVMLGGMVQEPDGPPQWKFFLVAPGDYTLRDTWHTVGMKGTGSNTIVTDNAFVPHARVLCLPDLRDAKTPGAALYDGVIFHTPFFCYAPISFITPMLGAVEGAYALFRDWTKNRKTQGGASMAETTSVQVRTARAAANIDAAALLIERAVRVTDAPDLYSPALLARSARDFTRACELIVEAIDTTVAISGTASFTATHPMQRAWRDIHFMAMHISLNVEMNYSNYGRIEFGLGRDNTHPYL
jgi:3-hydroxy-9,10-secoandrosta-1,3,5(10)-triene-9,17-dione monooxygenase